jgi:hypothetical protein
MQKAKSKNQNARGSRDSGIGRFTSGRAKILGIKRFARAGQRFQNQKIHSGGTKILESEDSFGQGEGSGIRRSARVGRRFRESEDSFGRGEGSGIRRSTRAGAKIPGIGRSTRAGRRFRNQKIHSGRTKVPESFGFARIFGAAHESGKQKTESEKKGSRGSNQILSVSVYKITRKQ